MNEINKRDTAILLAELNNEIDIKCIQLKENQRELKLKQTFLISCLFIFFVGLLQTIFNVFNINLIFIIIVYNFLALMVLTPIIFNISKGELVK